MKEHYNDIGIISHKIFTSILAHEAYVLYAVTCTFFGHVNYNGGDAPPIRYLLQPCQNITEPLHLFYSG